MAGSFCEVHLNCARKVEMHNGIKLSWHWQVKHNTSFILYSSHNRREKVGEICVNQSVVTSKPVSCLIFYLKGFGEYVGYCLTLYSLSPFSCRLQGIVQGLLLIQASPLLSWQDSSLPQCWSWTHGSILCIDICTTISSYTGTSIPSTTA